MNFARKLIAIISLLVIAITTYAIHSVQPFRIKWLQSDHSADHSAYKYVTQLRKSAHNSAHTVSRHADPLSATLRGSSYTTSPSNSHKYVPRHNFHLLTPLRTQRLSSLKIYTNSSSSSHSYTLATNAATISSI